MVIEQHGKKQVVFLALLLRQRRRLPRLTRSRLLDGVQTKHQSPKREGNLQRMGTPITTELRIRRTFEELQQWPPHRSSDLLARLNERRTQDRNAKRGEQVWNHIYMCPLSLSP